MDDPERRCRFWETCVCTHTECRAGWLDEDLIREVKGREYVTAQRCPICEEAQMMADELQTTRGNRGAGGTRTRNT